MDGYPEYCELIRDQVGTIFTNLPEEEAANWRRELGVDARG